MAKLPNIIEREREVFLKFLNGSLNFHLQQVHGDLLVHLFSSYFHR